MSIYVGTSEIKNVYVGTTPAKAVYVGTTKVRPSGYTPGSNTVAYFPFTINQLDEVGNAVIGVTGTKQSLGYNFNFSSGASISNITDARFCCFWVKFGTIKRNAPNQTPTLGYGELTYNYYHDTASAFRKTFSYQYSSSGRGHSNVYDTNSGQWYFLAYGYTGTNVVAYFNGIKVMDVQTSLYSGNKRYLGNSIDETLSELIFESKAWTATEVLDYYNKTKSKYGL